MLKKTTIFSILLFLSFIPYSYAQELEVEIFTEQKTYFFGDYLTFTIKVSKLVDSVATLHIVDENEKKSSDIPIPISQFTTTLTSPFPFDPATYPEGEFRLDIEYSGISNSTKFNLKDSGKIVIPIWIKDLGKMWVQDLIADSTFIDAIEFLVKNEIIIIPPTEASSQSNEFTIPTWVKKTTEWWVEGLVPDDEFGKALEYLIKKGIIVF